MNAVLVDQRFDGIVVALGFDSHQFGEQEADALTHFLIVLHPDVRLAIAVELFDRTGFVLDEIRDERAPPLMILFNRVAFRDAAQLREGDPGGAVVHRAGHALLVRDEPQLLQLRIPDVEQPHQIGPCFFERREVLLQERFRAGLEPLRELARAMADHFVQGREHVFRILAEAVGPLRFLL